MDTLALHVNTLSVAVPVWHVWRSTPLAHFCLMSVIVYVFFVHAVSEASSRAQPKAELTDSFPPRSPLVFLIDRYNAKVQALSLVPMLIAASCIFMSSLGIKKLNKGWGRWLEAAFITNSDWLERRKINLWKLSFFLFFGSWILRGAGDFKEKVVVSTSGVKDNPLGLVKEL